MEIQALSIQQLALKQLGLQSVERQHLVPLDLIRPLLMLFLALQAAIGMTILKLEQQLLEQILENNSINILDRLSS